MCYAVYERSGVMDTKKIGKFIAENRKGKGMTQAQLAEKIGVTPKTISRWENGNYMPDIVLLKPLSEELEISLNDLLSGEKIEQEQYQERLEENILNTIDYTNKKTAGKSSLAAIIILISGIICTLCAMTIFPSNSGWGGRFAMLGAIVALVGATRLTAGLKAIKRILICCVFFVAYIGLLFGIDYAGAVNIQQAPRFATVITTTFINDNKIINYHTPFYSVIITNPDTDKERFSIVKNDRGVLMYAETRADGDEQQDVVNFEMTLDSETTTAD